MPFELYRKYNTWKIKGELTYFRYQFNAYGIGFDTKAENKEIYKANAPRVRIDVLKDTKRHFWECDLLLIDFQWTKSKQMVFWNNNHR